MGLGKKMKQTSQEQIRLELRIINRNRKTVCNILVGTLFCRVVTAETHQQ